MSTYRTSYARLSVRTATKIDARLAAKIKAGLNVSASVKAKDELSVISSVTEKSLKELNYSTKVVTRGSRTAIEASGKGNSKLLVLIEHKGPHFGTGISYDWANLADKSCLVMQKELTAKMTQNGLILSDDGTPEQRHMDPRGGHLIAEAAKKRASDLATGILLCEESKTDYYGNSYEEYEDYNSRRRMAAV